MALWVNKGKGGREERKEGGKEGQPEVETHRCTGVSTLILRQRFLAI